MGVWKSDPPSITDAWTFYYKLRESNKKSGFQGPFPPAFRALLKESIRTSYQPGEGEGNPSEEDINAAYKIVAVRTAAYLVLKPLPPDEKQDAFLEANLSPGELYHLRELAQEGSIPNPIPFIVRALLAFLDQQRLGRGEQTAYQVYADLLKVLSEDKIKAFGNQMLKGSASSDVHVRQALSALQEAGTIDKETYKTFRQALGDKGAAFMAYFEKVEDDMPAFASKARNWGSTNNILKALAQEQNVASALSYALSE